MKLKQLIDYFTEYFHQDDRLHVYFSPGRVNLIGEHIDYNGGNVFPCALHFGTYAVVRKRSDTTVRMVSLNFKDDGFVEFDLSDLSRKPSDVWGVYPKGIFAMLHLQGIQFDSGLDILYYGTIPHGAGLSSSASIEVLTAYILNDLYDLNMSKIDMALIAQRCENDYVGVQCGIMDQFIIALGKKDHAVFLNTETLDYEDVPLKLEDYQLVITNTNVKRELSDSKYNQRRRECEMALKVLDPHGNSRYLGEFSYQDLSQSKEHFMDETIYRRARHVITECERSIVAVSALKQHDLKLFGQLMDHSHDSLQDDYEVSCQELDFLVDVARSIEGVLGSRMTGAGFGGCTVTLMARSAVERYRQAVTDRYQKQFGFEPTVYIADVGSGVCTLNLQEERSL